MALVVELVGRANDWFELEELQNEAKDLRQRIKSMKETMKYLNKRGDRGLRTSVALGLRADESRLDYVMWSIECFDSPTLKKSGYVPF